MVRGKFPCLNCDKTYSSKPNLIKHFLKIHPKNSLTELRIYRRRKLKCPLCEIHAPNFIRFKLHCQESHQICLDMHYYKFDSKQKFFLWKNAMEVKENSLFIKACADKLSTNRSTVTAHFQCHRSGYYRPRAMNRKRKMKLQGSQKINAHCPGKIQAVFNSNGTVRVTYCSTHLGHKTDLAHLRLTLEERKAIAMKIAAKIPFEKIIEEVQVTAKNGIKRKHFLTKHDLFNIQAQFGLKDIESFNQPENEDLQNINQNGVLFSEENVDYEYEEPETFDPSADFNSDDSLHEFDAIEENEECRDSDSSDTNCKSVTKYSNNRTDLDGDVERNIKVVSGIQKSTVQSSDLFDINHRTKNSICLDYSTDLTNIGPRDCGSRELEEMKTELIQNITNVVNNLHSFNEIKLVRNQLQSIVSVINLKRDEISKQPSSTIPTSSKFSNSRPTTCTLPSLTKENQKNVIPPLQLISSPSVMNKETQTLPQKFLVFTSNSLKQFGSGLAAPQKQIFNSSSKLVSVVKNVTLVKQSNTTASTLKNNSPSQKQIIVHAVKLKDQANQRSGTSEK
uniref:C2H2-type domain-containing protein n=1 Tax=Graphocephala atropunctata TaxID=36148 RepID=A0A1B6KY99_9HEMI